MYFKELCRSDFRILPKIEEIERFPLINSVVSGIQAGKIYWGERGEFFITNKTGFSFVSLGESGDVENMVSLIRDSTSIPQYFHIYDSPGSLTDCLTDAKHSFNLRIRGRTQLAYQASSPLNVVKENSQWRLSIINERNFESLENLGLDIANRFWNSKEDFLNNGLGVCILSNTNEPISVCYSACVVGRVAEIDIKTQPAYHRMGFGQIVTQGFVKLCHERDVLPNWDCFDDNLGSINTALKINFEVKRKYQLVSVFKK